MYFLTGPAESVKTVMLLSARYREGECGGTGELRRAYHRYLSSLGETGAQFDGGGAKLIRDDAGALALARAFGLRHVPSSLPARSCMPEWKEVLCQGGIERLQALNPKLSQVFGLTVVTIFSTPQAEAVASMTTAELPGVIWVGPTRAWSHQDMAEAYLHELTHTLLTLDEHRFGHYTDYESLREESNFCVSAIRREKRPLNAVIHSAFVAYELLRLRGPSADNRGARLHASSEEMHRRALASCESVIALPNLNELCTPRMLELISALSTNLRKETASVL